MEFGGIFTRKDRIWKHKTVLPHRESLSHYFLNNNNNINLTKQPLWEAQVINS